MQVAGLISAMMAMIVTVALGFLLEPLPKVRLSSAESLKMSVLTYTHLTAVGPGCLGDRQPEGHADAVQRNPLPMEKGQTRMCR